MPALVGKDAVGGSVEASFKAPGFTINWSSSDDTHCPDGAPMATHDVESRSGGQMPDFSILLLGFYSVVHLPPTLAFLELHPSGPGDFPAFAGMSTHGFVARWTRTRFHHRVPLSLTVRKAYDARRRP